MIRDRLLEAVGIQTEPEHVEKASRRERWKRQAWMIGSFAIASLPVFVMLYVGVRFVAGFPPGGPGPYIVTTAAMALIFVLDAYVIFPWGVDRWGLVVPWQFREERAKERDRDG